MDGHWSSNLLHDAFDGQGAITEVQLEAFDERQVFSQLPGSGEPM